MRISLTNIGSIRNGFSKPLGWIISQASAFGLGLKWFIPWVWKIHFRSRLCSSMPYWWERISHFPHCTVHMCENYGNSQSHCTVLHWQKFRESNVFTKDNTKDQSWFDEFFSGDQAVNFSFFHTSGISMIVRCVITAVITTGARWEWYHCYDITLI